MSAELSRGRGSHRISLPAPGRPTQSFRQQWAPFSLPSGMMSRHLPAGRPRACLATTTETYHDYAVREPFTMHVERCEPQRPAAIKEDSSVKKTARQLATDEQISQSGNQGDYCNPTHPTYIFKVVTNHSNRIGKRPLCCTVASTSGHAKATLSVHGKNNSSPFGSPACEPYYLL